MRETRSYGPAGLFEAVEGEESHNTFAELMGGRAAPRVHRNPRAVGERRRLNLQLV